MRSNGQAFQPNPRGDRSAVNVCVIGGVRGLKLARPAPPSQAYLHLGDLISSILKIPFILSKLRHLRDLCGEIIGVSLPRLELAFHRTEPRGRERQ